MKMSRYEAYRAMSAPDLDLPLIESIVSKPIYMLGPTTTSGQIPGVPDTVDEIVALAKPDPLFPTASSSKVGLIAAIAAGIAFWVWKGGK